MMLYDILIEVDDEWPHRRRGEIHVLGPVDDEFGKRLGPVDEMRSQSVLAQVRTIVGYGPTMPYSTDHSRRFELHRDEDETGISGTGVVAEGVVCRDGVAMMRWLTEWPSSVCYYERGIESVEALHGHGGKTRVVFLDE